MSLSIQSANSSFDVQSFSNNDSGQTEENKIGLSNSTNGLSANSSLEFNNRFAERMGLDFGALKKDELSQLYRGNQPDKEMMQVGFRDWVEKKVDQAQAAGNLALGVIVPPVAGVAANVANKVAGQVAPIVRQAAPLAQAAVGVGQGIANQVQQQVAPIVGPANVAGGIIANKIVGQVVPVAGAVAPVVQAAAPVVQKVADKTTDKVISGGVDALSAIQESQGLEQPGRKLTDDERKMLEKVFGNSLNYEQMRVKEGDAGILSAGDAGKRAITLKDNIYMKQNFKDLDAAGQKAFLQTLVHEATHSWQFQNGGEAYMRKALEAQMTARLESGRAGGWNDSAAYDFGKAIREGKPWQQLNPEQQAKLIEHAFEQGYFDKPGTQIHIDDGKGGQQDITAFVDKAVKALRNGDGAPR